MKQKPTANKAEKYNEEAYLKQQDHKDKEKRHLVDDLYKNRTLPTSRKPSPKGK